MDVAALVECMDLCAHSCHQHIDASAAEHQRARASGVDLHAPTADGSCPALTYTFGPGRCRIHAVRPMTCRLWGTSAAMPCPHGCRPEGGLVDDTTVMRWMLTSLRLGGHGDASADVAQLLDLAWADPTAASLLALYLRGDRTVADHRRSRLLAVRLTKNPPVGEKSSASTSMKVLSKSRRNGSTDEQHGGLVNELCRLIAVKLVLGRTTGHRLLVIRQMT